MSTPSIKVGQGNWGIKAGNLLGYANTEKKFSPVEFTSTRALNTATRVNASGNIEIVNANIPRIDYFGGQASLLVESSSQNLALQSENFGTTWSPVQILAFGSGSVLNTTATLDPYGTNVADLIVANTTLNQHRIDQTTTSVSGSYVFSVFLKAAGYGFARLRIGGQGAVFNLSTGVVFSTDAGITSSIQSFGNGWCRCIIGKAASVANEIVRINMQPTASTADFVGDGTSGFYVFGAQYEAGSVATSYIPTTTAAVTRNADVISVTGVAGLIGQTEGTLYAEVDVRSVNTNTIISLHDGTGNNRFIVYFFNSTTLIVDIRVATVNANYSVTIPAIPANGGIYKVALGYKVNDYCFALNGTTYASTASRGVPATTQINLGSNFLGASQLNDRIRAVALYQTRLPNTTTDGSPSLQSITTL